MSHCHCCNDCKASDTSASGETGTLHTPSVPTSGTATASSADTDSSNRGMSAKQIKIVPILSDLVAILTGQADDVPFSPFLVLAAQSVEFELSDRLMDQLDENSPTH